MGVRTFVLSLCVAFAGAFSACDDGDTTNKLGGSALAAGAKGLKNKASGKDAKVDGKSSSNSTDDVDLPTGSADTTQDGDDGDPVWDDVSEDVDGDGNDEDVDVTLDDETGTTYLHWTDSEDVDGDGNDDAYEAWAVVYEDGSGEIIIVFPGQGVIYCEADASGEASCEACDTEGQNCEDIGDDDDLGGEFDDDEPGDDCDQALACYNASVDACYDDSDCLDALEASCLAAYPCDF